MAAVASLIGLFGRYLRHVLVRIVEAADINRDWRGAVANSARSTFTTEPGRRWLHEWAERGSWKVDNPSDYDYSDAWQEIEQVALNAIDESEQIGDSGWTYAGFDAV